MFNSDVLVEYIYNNLLGILATFTGLIYLYYEYKANILIWPASIVMAIFYIYIFYSTQLFASMGIYIYFFLASIYGWLAWLKTKTTGENISHIPRKFLPPIFIAVFAIFIVIYFILYTFTDNSIIIVVGDALTTALSIVALWMAAKKWVEQWCLLIPVNAMLSILLILQGDYTSSILFFVYFVVSIFGYYKWKRLVITDEQKGKDHS